MIDIVVVSKRAHEAVAQTGLANAGVPLVLLHAGQADDGHVDGAHQVAFARHCDTDLLPVRPYVPRSQ